MILWVFVTLSTRIFVDFFKPRLKDTCLCGTKLFHSYAHVLSNICCYHVGGKDVFAEDAFRTWGGWAG